MQNAHFADSGRLCDTNGQEMPTAARSRTLVRRLTQKFRSLFEGMLFARSARTLRMRRSGRRLRTIDVLERRALLATFTVDSVQDSFPPVVGSLRWAIEQANANPDEDVIEFNLTPNPGELDVVIQPIFPLPAITHPVIIAGNTQPGYSTVSRPLVELRGRAGEPGAIPDVHGLIVSGPDIIVHGLAITRFTGSGILVTGSTVRDVEIYNNYLGTAGDGTADFGNLLDGITVADVSDRDNSTTGGIPVRIGINDLSAGVGNVISGNDRHGVLVDNAPRTLIQGNSIGVSANGLVALGNGNDGVRLSGHRSFETEVRSNVISGNADYGIQVQQNVAQAGIFSNIVGLNRAGTAAIPNNAGGVLVEGYAAQVANNTVSGNAGDGIRVVGSEVPEGVSGWFSGDGVDNLVTGTRGLFFGVNDLLPEAVTGRGLLFRGNTAYLSTSDGYSGFGHLFGAANPSTLEFWAKFDSTNGESVLAENYIKPFGPSQGWSLYKDASERLVLAMPGDRFLTSPVLSQFTDGEFHHFAVSRDAASVALYVDGTVVASLSVPQSESWIPAIASAPRFGYRNGTPEDGGRGSIRSTRFFNGILDEITAYTRALSAAEINNIVTAAGEGKPKPATGVSISSNFVGTDPTGREAIGNQNHGVSLHGTAWGAGVSSNVLSGNTTAGLSVHIADSPFTSDFTVGVGGNMVGTSADGLQPLGNDYGVVIEGQSSVIVGGQILYPSGMISGVISGNRLDGIVVGGDAGRTFVTSAYIGVDQSGERALPNGRYGVSIQRSAQSQPSNVFGHITVDASVISGNSAGGIRISEGLTFANETKYNIVDTPGQLHVEVGLSALVLH